MTTDKATGIDDLSDEQTEEFDVGVSFYGKDFVLTVLWTTDETRDDEVRINAATEWFAEEYGFDPSAHSFDINVSEVLFGEARDAELTDQHLGASVSAES